MFFTKLKSWLLAERPVTAAYTVPPPPSAALRIDELPPFTLHTADLMRFDPQVRIGVAARNGLLMAAEVEVAAADERVAAFVQRQWDRIWKSSAHVLTKAKLYGFLPCEVMYREGERPGMIEFDSLIDRHPRDARVLSRDARTVGFSLASKNDQRLKLLAPKALVCTYDAAFGGAYGVSLLERAYPPWYEKWMNGGAKKTLRLRMIKDAYLGDIFWYSPDRTLQLPSGKVVSWREIARDILEARLSGGAMTLPLMYDRDGNKLFDYTPPQDVGGATPIFQWKTDLDREIWKALEVPPEILEAGGVGSGYAGRSIPFTIALAAVDVEFSEIVRCVDRDILRPVTQLNFGAEPAYELKPRPLGEIYADERPSHR